MFENKNVRHLALPGAFLVIWINDMKRSQVQNRKEKAPG